MRFVRFHQHRLPLLFTCVIALTICAAAISACGKKKGGPSTIDGLKIDETVNLPGLDGPVDVVRDEWGRPHVYATDVHDLAMLTGWLHAEDRYLQMDLQRRVASSRLADLAGASSPSTAETDTYFHVIGLDRAAAATYATYPAGSEKKIAFDAYAEGVNAKVATFTTAPAPEYTVFGYPFAQTPPWTAIDSLSVAGLLAYQLDWDGDGELGFAQQVQDIQAAFPAGDKRTGILQDAYLRFKPSELVSIVDAQPPYNAATALSAAFGLSTTVPIPKKSLARAHAFAAHMQNLPLPLAQLTHHDKGSGSNDWVVSGSKTASHHPIVCNDPHLGLSAPPVWYELHWSNVKSGGDLDVTGVSFPGVPAIILGGNGHVAWGVTNVGPDATDTYIEHYSMGTGSNGVDQVLWDDDGPTGPNAPAYRDLTRDDRTISVRQPNGSATTFVDTVWLIPHRNGVIIPNSLVVNTAQSLVTGTAMSWTWTGFYPTRSIDTFLGLAHAKTGADVVTADSFFDAPPQNMVYADSAGNIGYTANGWYPVRGDDDGDLHTDPPFMPMPGWNGAHEWTGRLATAQVPHEENPTRGWEASSNQDPIGTNFDNDPVNDAVYLGALDWDIGFRGARIAEVLDTSSNITVSDMVKLQGDHRSNLGRRLVPYLLQSLGSTHAAQAAILASWGDRGYMAESGVGDHVTATEIDDAGATSLFNAWLVAARNRTFKDEEIVSGVGMDQFTASRTMLFLLEHPTDAVTYDATTGESSLWDDATTAGTVESRDDDFKGAMDDALTFLASPAGFNSSDPTEWRWGLVHHLTLSRQSGLTSFDIPNGIDGQNFPKGFPRHSDEFAVDVGNFGIGDDDFTYAAGASMREIIDLTPGHMRMYNQLPGGSSGDPNSPHYADRAYEYYQNISRETWYRESDVAGHGKNRTRFTP